MIRLRGPGTSPNAPFGWDLEDSEESRVVGKDRENETRNRLLTSCSRL